MYGIVPVWSMQMCISGVSRTFCLKRVRLLSFVGLINNSETYRYFMVQKPNENHRLWFNNWSCFKTENPANAGFSAF